MSEKKNTNTSQAPVIKRRPKKTYEIEVAGKTYPYRETMGAMLAFTEETGLDAPVTTQDNLKYMYHVLKSQARRHDGVPFDMSFEEFVDGLYADDYLRLTADQANDAEDGDDEKNG